MVLYRIENFNRFMPCSKIFITLQKEESRMNFQSKVNDSSNIPVDPTKKILTVIGFGLLISYILPILSFVSQSPRFIFFNIEAMSAGNLPKMVVFQLFYPLIAGLMAIVLAMIKRSGVRGFALVVIGIFPAIVLLIDADVRDFFGAIIKLPNIVSIGLYVIIGTAATFFILAGAHASRGAPANRIAGFAAALGAALYVVAQCIPINGKFQIVETIKLLTSSDHTMMGLGFLSGVIGLISFILMMIIAVRCFQLLLQGGDNVRIGKSIILLWFLQIAIYGLLVLYILFSVPGNADMGEVKVLYFWGIIMLLIKFLPWVFGLYLLIPLGIADFILLGSPVTPGKTRTTGTGGTSNSGGGAPKTSRSSSHPTGKDLFGKMPSSTPKTSS